MDGSKSHRFLQGASWCHVIWAVFCEDRVVKLFGCMHLLLANMFTNTKAFSYTFEALFSVFSDAPNKCIQLLASKDANLKGTLYCIG